VCMMEVVRRLRELPRRLGFRRPTPRELIHAACLASIIILAVAVRCLPIRWGVNLSGFDPFFQYRVTKYIVENGFRAWFTWHDYKSWYPHGRLIPKTSFPGIPFTAAAIYEVLRLLGVRVSVLQVCAFFPVAFGALTVLAAYFLGRDLGGAEAGLFSALFLAVTPAFVSRTVMGFFDDETIGILCLVCVALTLSRALQKGGSLKYTLLYSALSGLFLGYMYASWGAARYVSVLIAGYIVLLILLGMTERRTLVSYGLMVLIAYSIALQVPKLGLKYVKNYDFLMSVGALALLAVYEFPSRFLSRRARLAIVVSMIAALVGGYVYASSIGVLPSIKGKWIATLNPFVRPEKPLIESVAEHQRSQWYVFFTQLGIIIPLMMFGIYMIFKELDHRRLLMLLYGISALYFAGSMIRLMLVLGPAASIIGGYGAARMIRPFSETIKTAERVRRGRRLRVPLSREASAVFLAILLVLSVPTFWSSIRRAYAPNEIACSGIGIPVGGSYAQDWMEALIWMKYNIPDDAVVASWWDYGYWITTVANKTTVIDNGTLNATQIRMIALMFMSNETEALKILKAYNVSYVVVFVTFEPIYPYREYPVGDNTKWRWMARIAGLDPSEYWSRGRATDKFIGTVIYRLMYHGVFLCTGTHAEASVPPEHFELVYHSTNYYVLVYRVKYDL